MERLTNLPDILPVLPSSSMPVYPTTTSQWTVADASALFLLDDIIASHRLLVVAVRRPADAGGLCHIGTLARLACVQPAGDGKRAITLLGLERVTIGAQIQQRPYLLARVVLRPDETASEDPASVDVGETIAVFAQLSARSQKIPLGEGDYDFAHTSLREQAYIMALCAHLDLEQGQCLLELDSPATRFAQLRVFLTVDLAQFDQHWQAASRRVQEQVGSDLECALDRLHTATTLDDTFQELTACQSLLLSEQALGALRSRIALLHQQQAAGCWIFLLTRDLQLLKKAQQHGLLAARGYLALLNTVRRGQQVILEALDVLTAVDVDHPETLEKVLAYQQTHPFAPATFTALYALAERMQRVEDREQFRALLQFLEDVQRMGKKQALATHIALNDPDSARDLRHALDTLQRYLTSRSAEEAWLVLHQHQDVLLSDLVAQIVQQHVAARYRTGDDQSARRLERHLFLFADARTRGLEAAWQTFLAQE